MTSAIVHPIRIIAWYLPSYTCNLNTLHVTVTTYLSLPLSDSESEGETRLWVSLNRPKSASFFAHWHKIKPPDGGR